LTEKAKVTQLRCDYTAIYPKATHAKTATMVTHSGMPKAMSTATSQADFDRLKPQGSLGTIVNLLGG
jgi:hypothetical protein